MSDNVGRPVNNNVLEAPVTADANQPLRDELRRMLQEHCMQRGSFNLAFAGESTYFFHGKYATLSPRGAYLTGKLIFEQLRGGDIEAVGGKTLGADPMATAVAMVSGFEDEPIPAFIVRNERKDHGLHDLIAAAYALDGKPLISRGRRVAIIDDVATSGRSCLDAVEAVQQEGCDVAKVIVLVDRRQGAAERFRELGIDFEAVFVSDTEGNLSDWHPGVLAR
jgi:orotate phosphoribosyltransferase